MDVVPSILDQDPKDIDWKSLEKNCTRVHIDVMDKGFIGHTTKYTPTLVKKIRTKLVKDVHLMTLHPERQIAYYKKAGAKMVNIHVEIGGVLRRVMVARNYGLRVGLAINPETPVKALFPYIDYVDEFLIMSVHPGKGGQKFLKSSLKKIQQLRKETDKLIKVDGGITPQNSKLLKKAGADSVAVGSALFATGHPSKEVSKFR